ncbi:MAG: hypothetical protein AAFV80_21245 [Bacteroidota bacterium]
MIIIVKGFLWLLGIYVLIGLVFGFWFILQGLVILDKETQSAGWSFRFLMLPGAIGLWPVLLNRLLKVR